MCVITPFLYVNLCLLFFQEESRVLRVKVIAGIDLAKKDIFGARYVLGGCGTDSGASHSSLQCAISYTGAKIHKQFSLEEPGNVMLCCKRI